MEMHAYISFKAFYLYLRVMKHVKKKDSQGNREVYTGCPGRNVKYFGRVFLMLNYIDITQNTYIPS